MVYKDVPPDAQRCTFIKRTGGRCRQERMLKDDEDHSLCAFHTTFITSAVPARIRERSAAAVLSVSPMQVLLEEVQRSQLMVMWLEQEIAEKEVEELTTSTTSESRDGGPGGGYTSEKVEEKPSGLTTVYQSERAHLAHVTRLALQSGIEEKQLELNQQLAGTVIAAMIGFARMLGADPTAANVRQAMAQALKAAQDGRAIASEDRIVIDAEAEDTTARPGLEPPRLGNTRG